MSLKIRNLFVMILSILALNTFAQQEVIMDGNDPKDASIFLVEENGMQVLNDGHGNNIAVHPVFSLANVERVSRGWTKEIDRKTTTTGNRASGGPTFNLTYIDVVDGTNKGFDDPMKGEQRRTALETAFGYFTGLLEDDGEVDIEIRESFFGSPSGNPLAFSASYYFGAAGFNRAFTQQHIIIGIDPYPNFPDGYVQFNFWEAMNYHYSATSMPSADQFDFHTIAIHEVMHILGFTSYLDHDGNSAAALGVFTEFDELLRDYNKNELVSASGSGPTMEVIGPSASLLTNDQVWLEFATSEHAPVFSPAYFTGSSCDHFDNSRSGHGDYVMHPSLMQGDAFKTIDHDEAYTLESLGYQVNIGVATSILEDGELQLTGSLYPNPARLNSGVRVDVGAQPGEEILVIVYDMLGRESYSKVLVQDQIGPITAIDPYNNLSAGVYIVIGSSQDELFNQKLIIR